MKITMPYRIFLVLMGIVLSVLALGTALAQTETTSPLVIDRLEPGQLTSGQATVAVLYGAGFTADMTVDLSGVGQIASALIDHATMNLAIPAGLASGIYDVTLTDTAGNRVTLPNALSILQEATATPSATLTDTPSATLTPLPPATLAPILFVDRVEPSQVTAGAAVTISILGSNFTAQSVVRVVDVGLLVTTFVNANALTALLPENTRPGQYTVEVSDPARGTASASSRLTVNAIAPPTATAVPTNTPLPSVNEPALIVNGLTAAPNQITTGTTIVLAFTLTNQGTRAARSVSIALPAGSSFVPALGQAPLNITEIPPGASVGIRYQVTALNSITAGAASLGITISYADSEGKAYSTNASVGITVTTEARAAQLMIESYTFEPEAAEPGAPVLLTLTIANVGTESATQVVLRVTGDTILLPDARGDSFTVGDLYPNQQQILRLALIVSSTAAEGSQRQSLTLSYLQEGTAKETQTSVTVPIVKLSAPLPLLLIDSYDVGVERLQPGDRFTLNAVLNNVGRGAALDVLVTFGTVQTTDSGGTPAPGSSISSSTTPSTTFAPQGSDGRLFVGSIASGTDKVLQQEFIVAGSTKSGIYTLPITIQYLLPGNQSKIDTLNINLVVMAPPRLRFRLQSPLPEAIMAGEVVGLGIDLVNDGPTTISLTDATVEATHGEVLDGGAQLLETLNANDDAPLLATVMASDEGTLDITVTLYYIDDLNQAQTLVQAYSVEVMPAPPPPEEEFTPEPVIPIATPEPPDTIGRLFMALLGLGS